jgi:transposase-like protein
MNQPGPKRGRAFWERTIKELEAEGATVPDFARVHGLNPGTLAWWRSQLRREQKLSLAAGKPKFLEVLPKLAPSMRPAVRISMDGLVIELAELPPAAWFTGLGRSC